MKVNTNLDWKMESGNLNGQMVDGIKDNGKMANNTDMAYFIARVIFLQMFNFSNIDT